MAWVLAAAAVWLPAGAARAQQPAAPPAAAPPGTSTFPGAQQPQAPAQPRPAQPRPAQPPPARAYYPGEPRPSASGQPAPSNGQTVQQRYDAENPRLRFRPQADPYAPDPSGRRPTVYESASNPGTAARVQVDPQPKARVAPPSQVEQLVQRSQETIDFFELVDDIMDEIARQLSREDARLMSPMAIKQVRLSSNLRPEFANTLETRMIARLTQSTPVKMTVCPECNSLRSRVEDGNWILSLGTVNGEDLRRIGAKSGVKTFMDIDFTYSPGSNVVWMSAVVYRASDGGVVWSDAYRSDATMTALLRTGKVIPSRAERAEELQRKLDARPNYGYAISLGVAQIGYSGATGDIAGAQASLRFHEKFGEQNTSLFGMTAGIFTTGPPSQNKQPQALNSILLGAYYSYDLSPPNLNRPEVWVYGEGGGMFSGNEGNTFYLESGLDTHLKWRLSLQGGLMYVFHTKFSGEDLGGVGFRLRAAMNW
ncbi:MAG TPA: hypothetical protein VIF57_15895 [Polyangia bacterium]